MAVVGKFSLNGYSGKLVMRNFGVTRAVQITFDLGDNTKAADELLRHVEALKMEGGVTEVTPLRTPETAYVLVAGDLGLDEPSSSEMTVNRAAKAFRRLQLTLPRLKLKGDLESYSGL